MARIQILELPAKVVGEDVDTPFALVIDQVESEEVRSYDDSVVARTLTELTQDEAAQMAQSVGAVGAILTWCTLDVA